jgi:hypothetical protein
MAQALRINGSGLKNYEELMAQALRTNGSGLKNQWLRP